MARRSDCRYGPCAPPTSGPSSHVSPSQRRSSWMADSDARVERSTSVSSMRRMNVPPAPRASNQLNKAVRALPTWRCPVGLGAKRTRSCDMELCGMRASARGQECDRMYGNAFAPSRFSHALVRLALDAHGGDADAKRLRQAGADRVPVRRQPRRVGDDDSIDIRDRVACIRHDGYGLPEQGNAVSVLPAVVAVREVETDVSR